MFFDYFDGYLRVAFSRGNYGDLNMDLVLHGDTTAMIPCYALGETGRTQISTPEDVSLRTWFCASACPFRQFTAWLEAVTCGVQECAFQWDAEGPEGELRWFDLGRSGLLRVSWGGKERFECTVRLNKAQLVRTFYESLRAYVESDHYDPLDYESPSVPNLRELRSARVEDWLARQQTEATSAAEGTT